MSETQEHSSTPPPPPPLPPAPFPPYPYGGFPGYGLPTVPAQKRGKPFAISSLVVVGIGIIPLLVYIANAINSSPGITLIMGTIGFIVHILGLICGIVGISMGEKVMGILGTLGNGIILLLILLIGTLGISGI